MSEKYLTRGEAAEYVQAKGLRCAKGTLSTMATNGGGPFYRVFGNRSCYSPNDLDLWIESRLSAPRCSTSGLQA